MRLDTQCDKGPHRRYAAAVPTTWRLFTDDEAEREVFKSLAAVLKLPNEPAGPPNRLRHVVRIEHAGQNYYLKTFQKTQWKNRVHFLLSEPRAVDDADRERKVTDALRQGGYQAPRPVAYGRDGAAAYYLCAQLPGESLAEHMQKGLVDAALGRQLAAHCGKLLAAGFQLPDLSADHVFPGVDDGIAAHLQPAVLDLHNGGTCVAGAPTRKVLGRVLRRFARSVRGLPVDRNLAMAFAVRLLRHAGTGKPERRQLLTAAQPFGTAARYELGNRSRNYAERNPKRAQRERELLERVWPGNNNETVLDLPCGTGRLLPFLREHGHQVAQGDGAFAMLEQADSRGMRGELLVQANALQIPFGDGSVDGVVMFRFLHHLPPEAAKSAIAEACRVARRFVVVSFFHPCSMHHLQRRTRQLLGTPATRFAMTLAAIKKTAKRHGFELHRSTAQLPFARDLWLASFTRLQNPAARAGTGES
ncbi:MAG: ubiquinone/menaquinone biosynthesis C-methylase UbiE [Planctomycetota bacterium]|jgi:ubiquinone/menaquinone biosynthesis C-methylase UbiE